MPGTCAVRAQRGPPSSGSPFLAYVMWRSKRGRSAAGPRPGLVVRQALPDCFIRQQALSCEAALAVAAEQAKPICNVALTGETRTLPCRTGKPGVRPGGRPTSRGDAKRSRQEKATPTMAPRYAGCTRRQHRKREASETRCAQTADASLSVSGTGDAAPSNGEFKATSQATATATAQATATSRDRRA